MPDLSTALIPPEALEKHVFERATISDLYFEENDEIEEGELFAVLFNENGSIEITAPSSGVLVSLPYEEGGLSRPICTNVPHTVPDEYRQPEEWPQNEVSGVGRVLLPYEVKLAPVPVVGFTLQRSGHERPLSLIGERLR